MEKSNKQANALMLMILCGFCWSTSSLFIKMCDFSGLQLVCFRAILAGSFLYFYLTLYEKKKFIINKSVMIVGIFVCFKYITFVTANKIIAAANVVALAQMSTIYILIATCVTTKTLPRKIDVGVIVATIIGISLFFYGQFDVSGTTGNILGVLSGVCTAVMFFGSAKFNTLEENLSAIIMGNFLAAIVCGFLVIGDPITINAKSIATLVFLALVQQGIGFVLYTKAIRVISSFACAIVATIEPVLSPILVFLVLGEVPSQYAAYGAVIVIFGITAWSLADYKLKKKTSEVSVDA